MGLQNFVVWFSVGLIGTAFLMILFNNVFVVSIIEALVIGILGAKDG